MWSHEAGDTVLPLVAPSPAGNKLDSPDLCSERPCQGSPGALGHVWSRELGVSS